MRADSERVLTEVIVSTAAYDNDGPRMQYLWDAKVCGFGVRLSANGEKSYVVGYRMRPSSRMRFAVVGKVEQWKVHQARDQAREILVKHEDSTQATSQQNTAEELPNCVADAPPEYSLWNKRSLNGDKRQADRRMLDRRADRDRELAAQQQTAMVDERQKLVRIQDRQVRLTRKEFTLFKLLISEPGRVFSCEEIIELAWPNKKRASVEDVQQYIHLLRRKIETDPKQPQLIVTVNGFGYEFEAPETE